MNYHEIIFFEYLKPLQLFINCLKIYNNLVNNQTIVNYY